MDRFPLPRSLLYDPFLPSSWWNLLLLPTWVYVLSRASLPLRSRSASRRSLRNLRPRFLLRNCRCFFTAWLPHFSTEGVQLSRKGQEREGARVHKRTCSSEEVEVVSSVEVEATTPAPLPPRAPEEDETPAFFLKALPLASCCCC